MEALVKVRRKQIADGYLDSIYETLCGQNWTRAEKDFLKAPNSQPALDALQQAYREKIHWVLRSYCVVNTKK